MVWLLFHRYGKNGAKADSQERKSCGRNHMTINLVGLEGEGEVRGEGGSGWVKPGKGVFGNGAGLNVQ